MGRCGGLKEGGHHRKSIDVAAKKKALKADRKEAQLAAAQRAASLEVLLSLDADCDVYLEAATPKDKLGEQEQQGGVRLMCRNYFRYDRCGNRRCKFSHDLSIADALVPGAGSTAHTTTNSKAKNSKAKNSKANNCEDDDSGAPMSAMELIPSFLARPPSAKNRRRHRAIAPPIPSASGLFDLLPASAIQMITTYCLNAEVGFVVRSCRYLRQSLLDCEEIRGRKRVILEGQLRERNNWLRERAVAERLRFAISYNTNVDSNARQKGQKCRIRPMLVYDYENSHVFQVFESRMKSEMDVLALANCRVQDS